MNIPKILLQVRNQVLLLGLALGIVHQLLYRIVDVELLAPRESLGLPVTLYHRDQAPKFSRLAQAVNLLALVLLYMLEVLVYHCDAAFRCFHSLPVRKIVVAELDPLVIILVLRIEHLHRIERVLPHHIRLRKVECAALNARFVQVINQGVVRTR